MSITGFHLKSSHVQVLDLSPEREACIDYHLSSLPTQIGQLTNLRVLMLDTNQLDEIPPEIGLLVQLERITISNNRIRRLPDSFANLKRLESLHAANNRRVLRVRLCASTDLWPVSIILIDGLL